jgi:RHS repeat-associated protein
LADWSQDERDDLRSWTEFMSGIIIVVWEGVDPLLDTWQFHYDAAGSISGATVAVYQNETPTYYYGTVTNNDASHMQAMTLSGSSVTMAYDHLNRRVVKHSTAGSTVYIYDLFGNQIAEASSSGTIKSEWIYLGGQRLAMILPSGGGAGCSLTGAEDGAAAFLGLMGLVLIGIGVFKHNRKCLAAGLIFVGGVLLLVKHPVARGTVNDNIYYYHNDHLGTPRALTNAQAQVIWDVDYAPFGAISNSYTTQVYQPFRFPGQYQDEYSAWYYNWNRYYMPNEGRYNKIDDMNSISYPYGYTENNPVLYIDPEGFECQTSEDCLTCLTYSEARGTNDACIRAIASAILNRVFYSNRFPGQNDCCAVASSPSQFQAYGNTNWQNCCNSKCNKQGKRELDNLRNLLKPLTLDYAYSATYFHDVSILTPFWIKQRIKMGSMQEVLIPSCTKFRFYKLR